MAKLKTGRHTSAIKKVRQDKKKTSFNRGVMKVTKKSAKDLIESLENKDSSKTAELLTDAYSKWDKAAKKGTIHWKTAARKKSRLTRMVNKKSV